MKPAHLTIRWGWLRRGFCLGLICFGASLRPPEAAAVVGRAEEYDPFSQANLDDFHSEVLREERQKQLDRGKAMADALKTQTGKTTLAGGEQGETAGSTAITDADLKALQKELLSIPKRDRFRGGIDSHYKYESNSNRAVPRQEKGDSVFDELLFVEFDLSGKKTDLRFELRGAKEWNIKFPNKDYWYIEEALRYRKRYFKKIFHTQQSRIARRNEKTIEIDGNRNRWDSSQNMAVNFPLTRRFSVNVDVNHELRYFLQEAYDQDSDWQMGFHPAFFWLLTPKSRIQAGYRFGVDRVHSNDGNANSHEVHAGYFGRVTKKSSVSLDLSYSFQSPQTVETPEVNIFTIGLGTIYQFSPKTQLTVQFIRSLQNTTSNLTSGTADENPVTAKTDEYFTNDGIAISLNSRLTRKMTGKITFSPTHVRSRISETGSEDSEDMDGRQFTFPVTVEMSYLFKRWVRMVLAYSFAFRTGDEKADTYRNHLWTAQMQISF